MVTSNFFPFFGPKKWESFGFFLVYVLSSSYFAIFWGKILQMFYITKLKKKKQKKTLLEPGDY
jgi:hypothetical protein